VCDTLAFRTRGGMVFAKNSDRPPSEVQVLLPHGARPAGGALDTQYLRIDDPGASAFVGSHPSWLWGAEHGCNEHGVAIGNEKIWTVDDPHAQAAGLLGMDLVRLGLERGHDADSAFEAITAALEEHGQGGSGEPGTDEPYFSSFLVVDARGGWAIETSGRTWAARPVHDGTSISNRVSLTTDWTRASRDLAPGDDFDRRRAPDAPTWIADHRLSATRACVARRALGPEGGTVADVVATLRDHGRGPWGAPGAADRSDDHPVPTLVESPTQAQQVSVCMHLRDYQATTASLVVSLPADGAPRAWACLGSPCISVYVPFFPPDVPVVLRDPAQWQRFARLRDRAETEPDGLARVRQVLAPIEHDLWEAADAAYAAGTEQARATFAADATGALTSGLDTLAV
jgi:dipeptidase